MPGFGHSLDIGKDLKRVKEAERLAELAKHPKPEPEEHEQHQKPLSQSSGWKMTALHICILLIVTALILNQPAALRAIDIKTQALAKSVILKQTKEKVNAEWPLLSPSEKEGKVKELYKKTISEKAFKDYIADSVKRIKNSYRDSTGAVYLYKSDPYLWLRYMKDYLERGDVGYREGNSRVDILRNAPYNLMINPGIYPAMQALFFKAASVFGWSLGKAVFYFPLFLGIATVIIFYFLASALLGSRLTAFFASFSLAVSQRFFAGTFAGYADTQAVNILFSALALLLFFYASDWKNKARALISGILLFALLLLFSKLWGGWYFIVMIMAGAVVARGVINAVEYRRWKVLAYTAIPCLLIAGFLLKRYFRQLALAFGLSPGGSRIIPSITELQSLNFWDFTALHGGIIIMLIFLLGLVLLCLENLKKLNKNHAMLVVWLAPLLVATVLSRRFSYYLALPFAMFLGIGLRWIYEKLCTLAAGLKVADARKTSIAFAVLIPLIVFGLNANVIVNPDILPEVSDAYEQTGRWLQANTPENSIIVSYWDSGYYWQYFANRSTLIDNANVASPRIYWLDRLFTANDTRAGLGVLKMMVCGNDMGSYSAFRDRKTEVIKKFENGARDNSSCNNPKPTYVTVSEDMLYKLPAMKSAWDKALGTEYPEILNVSILGNCQSSGEMLVCPPGFAVNLTSNEATIGKAHPAGLVVVKDGIRAERLYSTSSFDFVIVVFNEGNEWQNFFISKKLSDSMLLRLFTGEKVQGFAKVYTAKEPDRIVTYAVNWSSQQLGTA